MRKGGGIGARPCSVFAEAAAILRQEFCGNKELERLHGAEELVLGIGPEGLSLLAEPFDAEFDDVA